MEINKLERVRSFDNFVRSHNWNIFMTTTFRSPVKTITIMENRQRKEVKVWLNDKTSARKEFQYFFSHLNSTITFFDKYILALVCFERAYAGAQIHIHSLIQGIHPQFCSLLQDRCYEFFGESKVISYDPLKAASLYFGWKYLKPLELVDFDFLRVNSYRRKNRKEVL